MFQLGAIKRNSAIYVLYWQIFCALTKKCNSGWNRNMKNMQNIWTYLNIRTAIGKIK